MEPIIEEPEETPRSSWVLVAQFFIVPVIIVGICIGIFVLFGLITGESRTARDYLEEIKAGKGNRRWQAAFELTKYLSHAGAKETDPRLARDITSAFRSAQDDDPRIRQYLALTLGRLGDKIAVDALIEALADSNLETQLYSVWALGEIRDPRAVDPLLRLVETSDRDLRKMAVYSLGLLQDTRALPALQGALHDRAQDVRWNAALALARLRDPSAIEVLHLMLNRKHLDSLPDVNDAQKAEAMINAANATALLKDATARPLLEQIRDTDPDMKVRSAAINALQSIR